MLVYTPFVKTLKIFGITIILFIVIEFFFYYLLITSENKTKIKKEYIPLLKYSKISKQDLINHFQNIELLDKKNNGLREYHPNLIYLYKPNLKSKTFYTNSLGLLDSELNLNKKKILILGSSVVGGGLRQNLNENIDGYLEKKIDEVIQKNKYEVINAGIGGYASTQEFILLHLLSNKINFDKVIYMSGANDIDARYRVKDKKDLRSYDLIHSIIIKSQIEDNLQLRKNPILSIWKYFKNYFLKSLSSYKYFSKIYHEKKVNKIKEIPKVNLNEKDNQIINQIVKNYISNVEKMILITKDKNTKLYVGIQPAIFFKNEKTKNEKNNINVLLNEYGYKYSLYFKKAYPKMKRGLYLLKKKYAENIIILDTDSVFNNIKIDIFRDNVHFLENANEEVAKKIFDSLIFQ